MHKSVLHELMNLRQYSTAHSPYSPLTVQPPSQVTSWLSKLDESYQTNGIHRILLSVASHRCQHHVGQTCCPEAQHTHSQCNSHMWYWSMPPTQFSSMSPRRCTLLSLLITKGTQPSDSSLLCACLRTLQNPLVCCTFSHGTPLWQALANWAAFTYESMDFSNLRLPSSVNNWHLQAHMQKYNGAVR